MSSVKISMILDCNIPQLYSPPYISGVAKAAALVIGSCDLGPVVIAKNVHLYNYINFNMIIKICIRESTIITDLQFIKKCTENYISVFDMILYENEMIFQIITYFYYRLFVLTPKSNLLMLLAYFSLFCAARDSLISGQPRYISSNGSGLKKLCANALLVSALYAKWLFFFTTASPK